MVMNVLLFTDTANTDSATRLTAGPAQFGWDFSTFTTAPNSDQLIDKHGYISQASRANPTQACSFEQVCNIRKCVFSSTPFGCDAMVTTFICMIACIVKFTID